MKKPSAQYVYIYVLLLMIRTWSVQACENESYMEAFLYNDKSMQNEPMTERFADCVVTGLPEISEVRVISCINHLAEGTFSNLPDLVTLSTVELCIKNVSPGFFRNTPNLRKVLLKSNHIEVIKVGTFRYANINHLDLSYNRINTIGDYAFGNMNNVALLDLEHNRLNEIHGAWFMDSEIVELNVANNQIRKIQKNTFNSIRLLNTLNLQYNTIHIIEEFRAGSLRGLQLAGNWLTDLDFLKELELTFLDISFNKISYIDFRNIVSIREIIIQPNPWQCACLRKFWKQSAKSGLVIIDSPELLKQWENSYPVCVVPEEQGHICVIKKDKRFFLAQENYFEIVHYDEVGKYS